MNELFRTFARNASALTGTSWAFLAAFGVVLAWAITGPMFGFSDTWQLVINTGTTIVTFLMVFLIQNTQNRDTRAIHAKLDELIVHETGAHNDLLIAEDLTDDDLEELRQHYEEVAARSKRGRSSIEQQLERSQERNVRRK